MSFPEITNVGRVFSDDNFIRKIYEVELKYLDSLFYLGILNHEEYVTIKRLLPRSPDVRTIKSKYMRKRHLVLSVVTYIKSLLPFELRKFVHYGISAGNVLDTVFSILIKDAFELISPKLDMVLKKIYQLAKANKSSLCPGRTHLRIGTITTYGFRFLSFYNEIYYSVKRLRKTVQEMLTANASGSVGNYFFVGPEVEEKLAEILSMSATLTPSQMRPYTYYLSLFNDFFILSVAIKRMFLTLLDAQRDEISEITFRNYIPSSAMPHKKNPSGVEKILYLCDTLSSICLRMYQVNPMSYEFSLNHYYVIRTSLRDVFTVTDDLLSNVISTLENTKINVQKSLDNVIRYYKECFAELEFYERISNGEADFEVRRKLKRGATKKYFSNINLARIRSRLSERFDLLLTKISSRFPPLDSQQSER